MLHIPDIQVPETGSADSDLWGFSYYVSRRWRVLALALAVAMLLVLVLTTFVPKKYTATVSILIEPPAGNDPRGSTAISPVYLESLKTYEHFASSNSLFAQAVEALNLRQQYGNMPIESLKRSVLEVTKPRDTKVLEIKATLKDPALARELAHYLGVATVQMNRSLDRASSSDLTEGGDTVLAAAKQKLQQAKSDREHLMLAEPIAQLESEASSDKDLQDHVLRDLSSTQTDLAAYESRTASGKQGPAYMDTAEAGVAVSASRAEIASLSSQLATLRADLAAKIAVLEIRKQHRDMAEKEIAVAQQQFDAATTQRNEIVSSISFRGERLEIIDPGVVPQKPSSPNLPLNVTLGAAAALLGGVFYLAVEFARRKRFVR